MSDAPRTAQDEPRAVVHMVDEICLDPDSQGFYVPQCACGKSFGVVSDLGVLEEPRAMGRIE